jgi:hypothetical protein
MLTSDARYIMAEYARDMQRHGKKVERPQKAPKGKKKATRSESQAPQSFQAEAQFNRRW